MSQSSNKKIHKAFVLAAGLGTRLRPLTFKTPKPMLTVGRKPLLDHNLELLKKAGVKEVVINLHHLGDQIKKHVGDGKKFGLKVRYSKEKVILGTGGGIKKAERFFKNGPFFVINADVWAKIDLKKVEKVFFEQKNIAALMVVRHRKRGEDFAKLDVDSKGQLKSFGRGRFMFTGVQILTQRVFDFLKIPSCLIQEGYKKFLENGMIVQTFIHDGFWNDVGTLKIYKKIKKITT